MHELRQAPPAVKGDAAKVFSVDRCAYVVRDHGAAPTCTHDRDQDILGPYGVTPELLVLLRGDEPRFTFPELIGNGVIYPEYANPFVDKFAVQQLASKWTISPVSIESSNRLNLEVKPLPGCAARWWSPGATAPSGAMVLQDSFGALRYRSLRAESERGLP